MEIWKPNVTVAAVVERDGRFLVVEEETDDGLRFNQPAGHLEKGESLVAAAAREALEETAHRFRPERFLERDELNDGQRVSSEQPAALTRLATPRDVPPTPEAQIQPRYRGASQIRAEFAQTGKPVDRQ